MSSNIIQSSFASGELSPTLFARVDLTKYHTGVAMMRNFFVDYRSGASTRPGSKFCNQARQPGLTPPPRLIPFQSSALVPYIVEFGDKYCRFYSFGAPVTENAFAISGATQANPCVVTVVGNNFAVGDWVFISNVGGMTQLNSRSFFQVLAVNTNLITLGDVNGNAINSLSFNTWTSGGSIARIYTIVSPYAVADLPLLKYVQITNTMYVTHPSYAPQILTFTSPTSWAFTTITFGTSISAPTSLSIAATTGTGAFFSYAVTAVDTDGQESLMATVAANNVVDITTTVGTITVSWTASTGAVSYNVYRAELSYAGAVPSGAAYGFQQSVTGTSAVDSNIVPDFTQTPPITNNPFANSNNPGTCCFFQQRLYYGGSNLDPQTFWASQPGLYNNFNFSNPTEANDELEDTLISKQVNAIKNMLPMPGGLVIFTAQGAWQLASGTGSLAATGAVTPINAIANPQTYNGAADLPPIPINWDVLYPQLDGAIIDLSYNIYAAIYTGSDISVLSNHLFFGYTLREWAYAQKPFKIVWSVRNDGTLLSLTYVKEQEMSGWARHDTLGLFKSVATVLEGQYDATYVVVERFIGGQWNYYVERFDNRVSFTYGAEDAWAVDCGIISVLPTPSANLTISASTGTAIFTADAAVFGSALPGDVIRAYGGIATITTVLSNQVVEAQYTQNATQTLPNDPYATPLPTVSGNWSLARPSTVFTGLDYLNGQMISILADGGVIEPQVVVNGTITLQNPATKVVAGLGFTKQLQTMPLDLGNERDTVQGKRIKVNAVTVRVANTRALQFGNKLTGQMFSIKEMNPNVQLGSAIPLVTGDERVVWDPLWATPNQICFQSTDPLPATILGIVQEITIGDTPGKP